MIYSLFKRLRLKFPYYLFFLSVAVTLLVTGCVIQEDKAQSKLLTVKHTKNIFSVNGVKLIDTENTSASEFALNGLIPEIFKIESAAGTYLFVYEFGSFDERIAAMKVIENQEKQKYMFGEINKKKVFLIRVYKAKNLILVLAGTNEEPFLKGRVPDIGSIIFSKLNDINKIIFQGEGNYWDAKMVVEYYEYQWEGEKTASQYERYYESNFKLCYKGNDVESVGKLKYKYEGPTDEVDGTKSLNEEGCIEIKSTGDVQTSLKKQDVYTVTIRWKDQQETITLNAL